MWTDAKTYQGLSRPLRACVSFRVKAFQSIPRRILSTFCAISASLPGPIFSHHQLNAKTNQCEWRKMCWYAVTRLVSSILGCQEPRFSFQIATIVVLKSRPPTTNQPQWGGQGSNADRNIRQKFPYNRAPANTLLIGCFFTG